MSYLWVKTGCIAISVLALLIAYEPLSMAVLCVWMVIGLCKLFSRIAEEGEHRW